MSEFRPDLFRRLRSLVVDQTAKTLDLTVGAPCRPCHKPACGLRHHRRMRDIPMEQVAAPCGRRSILAYENHCDV